MAGVEFIGAGKTYVNGTQAVHPSDRAIDDGESMVLVGSSGATKPHCSACSRDSKSSPKAKFGWTTDSSTTSTPEIGTSPWYSRTARCTCT